MSKTIYDFDKGVERRGTDAKKYDPSLCPEDVLPFWIADTDFPSPVGDRGTDGACKDESLRLSIY